MSGGTLTIGTGNDTRIQVAGNFTATGGAITSTGGTLSVLGATTSLSGTTTLNTSTQITLEGTVAQSLSSSVNLNTVLLRNNNTTTDVAKTITLTGSATTVGQLQFRTPTAGRATNLVLGSNLTSSASAANPSMIASTAGTVGAGIDTAGFTLDLLDEQCGSLDPEQCLGCQSGQLEPYELGWLRKNQGDRLQPQLGQPSECRCWTDFGGVRRERGNDQCQRWRIH